MLDNTPAVLSTRNLWMLSRCGWGFILTLYLVFEARMAWPFAFPMLVDELSRQQCAGLLKQVLSSVLVEGPPGTWCSSLPSPQSAARVPDEALRSLWLCSLPVQLPSFSKRAFFPPGWKILADFGRAAGTEEGIRACAWHRLTGCC